MALGKLVQQKANRVLGIDASTNSIAFCLLDDNKPVRWGKINLNGQDIYEKILDAKRKTHAMLDLLKADYIVVEGAILVRSPDAVIKLAYVYGVVISELMTTGTKVITVAPTSWQSFIGNKNPTKKDKEAFKLLNPDRSDSWIKTKLRENRKQMTVDYFNNKYGLTLSDFDVADSFGIAYYGNEVLTKR